MDVTAGEISQRDHSIGSTFVYLFTTSGVSEVHWLINFFATLFSLWCKQSVIIAGFCVGLARAFKTKTFQNMSQSQLLHLILIVSQSKEGRAKHIMCDFSHGSVFDQTGFP